MINLILSLLVIAAAVLAGGAIWMVFRHGWSRHPVLMLVLAIIMVINAALLSWPVGDRSPASAMEAGGPG